MELEVIALHLEQRASWHWFTKAYPICDPLSFERDVSSPCQKCTLHIPRKPLTGPTVILCKPVWTCFFSSPPHRSHSWLFFPLQERTQKPIKKIKIKHFCLYHYLHCKPFYSSYAKRKHKTIRVILQKRSSKKHLKDRLSVTFPRLLCANPYGGGWKTNYLRIKQIYSLL